MEKEHPEDFLRENSSYQGPFPFKKEKGESGWKQQENSLELNLSQQGLTRDKTFFDQETEIYEWFQRKGLEWEGGYGDKDGIHEGKYTIQGLIAFGIYKSKEISFIRNSRGYERKSLEELQKENFDNVSTNWVEELERDSIKIINSIAVKTIEETQQEIEKNVLTESVQK